MAERLSRRLRFWLLAMDALDLCGLSGSRAWMYALARASDATDWRDDRDR